MMLHEKSTYPAGEIECAGIKKRSLFAICALSCAVLLLQAPARANHKFISITNNTTQRITGVGIVFQTGSNGALIIENKARDSISPEKCPAGK